MKLKIGILVCLIPFLVNMASADNQPLTEVVKSVNDFTLDLYLTTTKDKGPGKNVLVSPLSAALATAMVYAGAQGKTAEEIETVLHFPKDKKVLESGLKELNTALSNTENVTLDVANKIFVEQSVQLKQDYSKTLSEIHKSDVQKADFKSNPEKERVTINGWVSEKTHEKIKDLLAPGILTGDTRLVLVNAVYFYGKWKEQFDPAQTHDEDFYVTKDKTVRVPMMHMTKNLRFAEIPELDAKAVELCYANPQVCLQVILPNAKDGLESLHEKLRNKLFDLSNIDFYSTKVQLSMPKFKIEETINLKAIYQKMGINTMFSKDADLSGMLEGHGKSDLCVSDAVQKTFMDVNEEGTEAAAATACVGRRKRCAEMPVELYLDHPFLFRLNNFETTVFIGTHYEPTVSGDDDLGGSNECSESNENPLFYDVPKPTDDVRSHKPSRCEL